MNENEKTVESTPLGEGGMKMIIGEGPKEEGLDYEKLIPLSDFKDSVLLIWKGGIQLEVQGSEKEAKRFRLPWPHRVTSADGWRKGWVRGWGILFSLVYPATEKRAKAIEAVKKAEAQDAERREAERQQKMARVAGMGGFRVPGRKH